MTQEETNTSHSKSTTGLFSPADLPPHLSLAGPWRFVPIATALLAFGIYVSTICPTVYMGDSGELTAAAFSLGVAHNSGYPLYVLLGKLFSLLPLGTVAFKVNLVSATFAALSVWLVFSTIFHMTGSVVSAIVGALLLAFAPILWLQTSCSEVYALHVFFVALLMWLLLRWERQKTLQRLALLAFMAGISFGNHTQTVMLAPAVLFMVISGDYRSLLRPQHFIIVSALFLFALSLYIMLPVRTMADAALHWGDPDTLDRFLAHVTARVHRSNYVFNRDLPQYMARLKEITGVLVSQFGVMLVVAAVGWLVAASRRWKVFFLTAIMADLFYSLFLNIVSVEITPFGLPSSVFIAVLIGLGLAHITRKLQKHMTSRAFRITIGTAVCLIPGISLGFNYDGCDQSRNYLAYEHAVNILNTVENHGTLITDGDNHIFPVMYTRIVEGARPDMRCYDRLGLFFKMPEGQSENEILESGQNDLYYAVFNPAAVSMPPGYTLKSHGILYKAQRDDRSISTPPPSPWRHYMMQSMESDFFLDFMNRQVAAHIHFALARFLMDMGKKEEGLDRLSLASTVGYNDETIHLEIASYLLESPDLQQDDFNRIRSELEKALLYHEDLSGVYNNWGYYYYKRKDHDQAVVFYEKALSLKPDDYGYYNNLGLALLDSGKKEAAHQRFQKSLELHPDQPDLRAFLKTFESGE